MKNTIRVYTYHDNEIKRIIALVNTFYKHPVEFVEHKTAEPETYYDNWVEISSDYANFALSKKLHKLCSGIRTIAFPKNNGKQDNSYIEIIEKLRQKQLASHVNKETKGERA